MAKPDPLTDDERATIKAMHAEGAGCSAIARHLERSPSTVSRAAKAMGLEWDTAQTEAATAVKQASNRERRARLVRRLYDRADFIMDRLDAEQFKLVGMDKEGNAHTNLVERDAIPGTEERALFGMVINGLNAAARLEAVDSASTNATEAKGILGDLGDALSAAYGQLAHAGSTPTADALEDEMQQAPDPE